VSFAYTSMQDRKIPLEFPVTGRVTVLRNIAQIQHKIPIYNNLFPGVRGLTASSYIVYD